MIQPPLLTANGDKGGGIDPDADILTSGQIFVETTIVLTTYSPIDSMMLMSSSPAKDARAARFDSLQQEAYLSLWRTYDRLKAIEDELFSKFDLSAQQYNALRLLQAAHPGTMPTLTLGARLISRAPDMTRMLDRLEERGLVHRERRPENRRVVEVGISPAGLQLLNELSPSVQDCHQRQLGHVASRDLKQLVDLLQAVRRPHEDPDQSWPKR